MDPQQAALVQRTFERAARIGPHFSATFYNELFLIEPPLKRMFSGDMIRQGEQLMMFLAYIVQGLDPDGRNPAGRPRPRRTPRQLRR